MTPSRVQDGKTRAVLTASEVAQAVSDPFGLWMDHYGDLRLKDPEDEYDRFLAEQGLRIEKVLVHARHDHFEDLSGLPFASAQTRTAQLLGFGTAVIYDGAIFSRQLGLRARPDLLAVERGRCRVEEYKLAGSPTEAHEIQALVYAHILVKSYGMDAGVQIVSRHGEVFSIAYDENRVHEAIHAAREILSRKEAPHPFYNNRSRWRRLQNKVARDSQDVTLAWHVGPTHARRLHRMGIHSLTDLSNTGPDRLKTLKGLGTKKIPRILDSARAQLTRKVIRVGEDPGPGHGPEREIFLDLEGTGELFQDDPAWNCIYLVGLIVRARGIESPYRSFLAVQPGDEPAILRRFVEYLQGIEGTYRLYHWDHYERTQLRRACERHKLEAEFERWILPHLDDLCRRAQNAYVLPTPGYSIKVVAPYFGFQWTQSIGDVDAMKSAMIWYRHALEGGNREELDRVLKYNEDDCRAMIVVKDGMDMLARAGDGESAAVSERSVRPPARQER